MLKVIIFYNLFNIGICDAVKSLTALDNLEAGFGHKLSQTLKLKEALMMHCSQNHDVSIRKTMSRISSTQVRSDVRLVRRNSSSSKTTQADETKRGTMTRTYRMRMTAEADEENTLAKRKAKRAAYNNRYSFNDSDSYESDNANDYGFGRGEAPDFTACGRECGYCGRCDY